MKSHEGWKAALSTRQQIGFNSSEHLHFYIEFLHTFRFSGASQKHHSALLHWDKLHLSATTLHPVKFKIWPNLWYGRESVNSPPPSSPQRGPLALGPGHLWDRTGRCNRRSSWPAPPDCPRCSRGTWRDTTCWTSEWEQTSRTCPLSPDPCSSLRMTQRVTSLCQRDHPRWSDGLFGRYSPRCMSKCLQDRLPVALVPSMRLS